MKTSGSDYVTTLQLRNSTLKLLEGEKKTLGLGSYDEMLKRLLSSNQIVNIDTEIISVDGHPVESHTVIFRLGDYYYQKPFGGDGASTIPIKKPQFNHVLVASE